MVALTSKIVLGTVQFGIKYGINHISKPSSAEVQKILSTALNQGVTEIDTAGAYGNALEILAACGQVSEPSLKIMTKVILESGNFLDRLKDDLKRLSLAHVEGCYLHRYEDLNHPELFSHVQRAKEQKLINKFGVSIYSLEQLEDVKDNYAIDVIQIPFNIFDQDKAKIDLLEEARKNGKLIYARSVFLQGLFFMNPSQLPQNLKGLSVSLSKLQKLASQYEYSLHSLCLKYVLDIEYIDKVIIGVETEEQLSDNLKSLKLEIPLELRAQLELLDVANKELINPLFWK